MKRPDGTIAGALPTSDDHGLEPLISHRDVTTIMGLLGDIRDEVAAIRGQLEEDDGEEEEEDSEDA